MHGDTLDIVHLAFGGMGGHRSVVHALNTEFRSRGYRVGAILVDSSASNHPEPESWACENVFLVGNPKPWARSSEFRASARDIEDVQARILLAHSHVAIPEMMLRLSRNQKKPVLVTREGHASQLRSLGHNVNSLVGLALGSATVFPSELRLSAFPLRPTMRLFRSLPIVIPNPVEAVPARMSTSSRASASDPILIGSLTRLVEGKRIDLVLDAVSLLVARGIEVRLKVAGDGPLRPILMQRVEERHLANHVEFLGVLSPNETVDFLATLDIFLHITAGEGQSNSLLEAAAHRLPIIASDVPGVSEVFIHLDRAILVSNYSANIASAVELLHNDDQLAQRLAQNAYDYVTRVHSLPDIVDKYISLFKIVDREGPWNL